MLTVDGAVHLSASDLVGHLNCRYLTSLDLAVAKGTLAKPFIRDPVLEVLAERGIGVLAGFGSGAFPGVKHRQRAQLT